MTEYLVLAADAVAVFYIFHLVRSSPRRLRRARIDLRRALTDHREVIQP